VPERFSLLLATHHKTGSTLSGRVASKIQRAIRRSNQNMQVHVNMHWGRVFFRPVDPGTIDGFPNGYRVVHFVRSPISAVISGYLYHRDVPTRRDYGMDPARVHLTAPELLRRIRDGETYSSFLRRVSLGTGLHAELHRFYRAEYDEWAFGFHRCHSSRRVCSTVCLEEFAHDYNATWKRVIGFAGYDLDTYQDLMDELSMHDVRLHPVAHVTAGGVTAKERMEMVSKVAEIDRSVYDGKLAALSGKIHACGGSDGMESMLVSRSGTVIEDGIDAWA